MARGRTESTIHAEIWELAQLAQRLSGGDPRETALLLLAAAAGHCTNVEAFQLEAVKAYRFMHENERPATVH
jgi:hypothetical protein